MIYVKMSGGLGNQMFQYAVARWVQCVTKQKLCLDYSDYGSYELNHNATFQSTMGKLCLSYDEVIYTKDDFLRKCTIAPLYKKWYVRFSLISRILFFEGRMGFERLLQPKLNRLGLIFSRDGFVPIYPEIIHAQDIVLSGFFQSPKYFSHLRSILLKEFCLSEEISEENKIWINIFQNCNSVCLHIRRGDYALKNRMHCTISYYQKAIEKMLIKVKNPHFFVFSDDLNWVKENLKTNVNITFVDSHNDSCNELNIMKHCKNFIISNSTFSWWAQYLSDNLGKVVVAPRPWLRKIPSDIYMENWITIPVYE